MKQVIYIATFLALGITSSCKKFIDVNLTESLVNASTVFTNDITATAAVTAIYHDMLNTQAFSSGSFESVTSIAGLSADELVFIPTYYPDLIAINENIILPDNATIYKIWKSAYKTIYEANAVLEGLDKSDGVSAALKSQLQGEALFARAFAHFYLTNLFGAVPIVLTTDYRTNAAIAKASRDEVYKQIITDLDAAKQKIGDNYITEERVRPNKAAITAFLARVHLYTKEWEKAEAESSELVGNGNYNLVDNPDQVFLKNSSEAIFQLMPVNNTLEAETFIILTTPTRSILSTQLLNAFESGDLRQSHWISSATDGTDTWQFAYKYKLTYSSAQPEEYSMVLRLAEQYLIRAEARMHLNKLTGVESALSDINTIRDRAGLLPLNISAADEIMEAIIQERRVELFCEWGHRWLDLKRWNKATEVLQPIKSSWNKEDVLYPLPQTEMNRNPNLKPQNDGY